MRMHHLRGIPFVLFALVLVLGQYGKGEVTDFQLLLFVSLSAAGIIAAIIWSASE